MLFESKRKPKPPRPVALERAKKLKALGVIDYDLRKPLTKSQSDRIRRLSKDLAPVLASPKDFLQVKASTMGNAAKARDSGLIVKGKAVFVPKTGYDKAKMIDDRIIMTRKKEWLKQDGKMKYLRKRQDILLHRKADIFSALEKMDRDREYLPPNATLAVRIGNNRSFPGGISKRYDARELLKYVTAWQSDDMKAMGAGEYTGKHSAAELLKIQHGLIAQMVIISYRV